MMRCFLAGPARVVYQVCMYCCIRRSTWYGTRERACRGGGGGGEEKIIRGGDGEDAVFIYGGVLVPREIR